MEDSLNKRYIVKLLGSFISGLVNILVIALVPQALGAVAYGQFIYLQQFFSQFIGLLDAGTSTAFFTKLSEDNKRSELVSFYFTGVILMISILILLIFFLQYLEILNLFIPNIDIKYIYFGVLFGFLTWLNQVIIKISDAYVLTVSVEFLRMIHKFFSLLLLLLFLYVFSLDLANYYYFNFVSSVILISAIIFFFFKKRIFTSKLFSLNINYSNLIKEFYRFSFPLFTFNIIAITISLFNLWLLQRFSGSIEVGYYGLAYSIAAMCLIFTAAMTQLISREFSKYFMLKDFKKIKYLFEKNIPMLYALSTYFGVFIAFESTTLLSIFTDEEFKNAHVVLVIMAFYPLHQTYGQLSGSLFFSTGRTREYRNIGIVSSIISLVLSVLFIYIFDMGAIGFAAMMLLSQFISVNIQLYSNSTYLNMKYVNFLVHQVLTIFSFSFLAYLATSIVGNDNHDLVSFLAKGLIYTLLIIVTALVFPYFFRISRIEIRNMYRIFKKGFIAC